MELSAKMWQAAAQSAPVTPLQLQQILQQLEAAMTALELLHAFYAEALKDPAIEGHPITARLTGLTMTNLVARVAAAGMVRRLLSGDSTQELLTLLKEQLTLVVRTRRDAQSNFERLLSDPAGRANRALQGMGQVVGLLDQYFVALRPLLANLVSPELLATAQ